MNEQTCSSGWEKGGGDMDYRIPGLQQMHLQEAKITQRKGFLGGIRGNFCGGGICPKKKGELVDHCGSIAWATKID